MTELKKRDCWCRSGVIERWELLQAQRASDRRDGAQRPQNPTSDLNDITRWLEDVTAKLCGLQQCEPAGGVEEMEAKAKELKVELKTKHGTSDVGRISIHVPSPAGNAEDVYPLQVCHAVGQPEGAGSSGTTGRASRHEPGLEPSLYGPPAVGREPEEDSAAL